MNKKEQILLKTISTSRGYYVVDESYAPNEQPKFSVKLPSRDVELSFTINDDDITCDAYVSGRHTGQVTKWHYGREDIDE